MSARIDAFPDDSTDALYSPVGVATTVAGTGFHLSKILTKLGDEVRFASFVGRDSLAQVILDELDREGISSRFVLPHLDQTLQSIVVLDSNGLSHEMIDLKGIQHRMYPKETLADAARDCSYGILCETGLSQRFIDSARELDLELALYLDTAKAGNVDPQHDRLPDVDIVFASHRSLPVSPKQWVMGFRSYEGPEIVVVSLGAQGSMIWVRSDDFIERLAAPNGRASSTGQQHEMKLFSMFIHGMAKYGSPYESLERALNAMFVEQAFDDSRGRVGDLTQRTA